MAGTNITRLGPSATPRRQITFSPKSESIEPVLLTPVQIAGGLWLVRWTSNYTGAFLVYRDGKLLGVTHVKRFHVFVQDDDEAPLIEVLPDSTPTPVTAFSARLELRFSRVAGAVKYTVEQLEGGSWVNKANIREDGRSVYEYRSDVVSDDTTHQFRVSAVDADGQSSTPATVSKHLIRHPDPPDVSIEYDLATGKMAIEGMA